MKQKQVQNVKIVIGELKRKAPARQRAPRRAPRRAPPGGGGALPQPPPPPLGAPGNQPFPQMFAARAGPVVESLPQLQQLVRPLEQSLLRLEQRALAAPAPALPTAPAQPMLNMRDIQDYVARYYESVEQQPDFEYPQGAARASSSSSSSMREIQETGAQTDLQLPPNREVGIQYQIEQPDQAFVQAIEPPLVDAVVAPHEAEGKQEIIIEEININDYTPEELRQLRRDGTITKAFLNDFTVKRSLRLGHNLLTIAGALGIALPKAISRSGTKTEVIDYILSH